MTDKAGTTSPMRQAVIAAVTVRAARDPEARGLLAGELAATPYEARDDDDLFRLAELVGVPADRLAELAALDAGRAPERQTVICDLCKDTGSIVGAEGRYVRCHVCNPDPPPEEDQ